MPRIRPHAGKQATTRHAGRVATWLPVRLLAAAALAATTPVYAASFAPVRVADAVASYPHDVAAFTQGLLYFRGRLYESTGLHDASSLRRVRLADGKVLTRRELPAHLFGEGLARVGHYLYQLTWKAGVARVHALPDMRLLRRYRYRGQGWGLTWDGEHLVMSDGSATLRFITPDDFVSERELTVTYHGAPVPRLNELAYFCGAIWANIRYADVIVRIDPASGVIIGSINATSLRDALPDPAAAGVLNGIAWNPDTQRILVTGKNWPLLFAIRMPWPCPQQ